MKTGSDLTELQAFRNHTSHKQSCLNSDCLLFGRKAINVHVANSVLSSALHCGCTERGRAVMAFSVSSKCRDRQDGVVMDWLRRQLSARVSMCKKDMHSASHCLAQDRVGFMFDLNIEDEFRVGAFLSLVLTFLQM